MRVWFLLVWCGWGLAAPISEAWLQQRQGRVISRFEHAGVSYQLWATAEQKFWERPFEFRYLQRGEFFLPLGFTQRGSSSHSVVEDIVSFSGSPRRVDLRCLHGEAFFSPKSPLYVSDTAFTKDTGTKEYEVDTRRTSERLFPDLVERLREQPGGAYPIGDRDLETVLKLRRVLLRPEKASAVVLGEPGTGKTELIKSFARAVAEGKFPEIPRTLRIFHLEAGQFQQGASLIGIYDTRLNAILATSRLENSLLFMDEIQSLVGVGTHAYQPTDIFGKILPLLADGSARILATSNEYSFYAAFGGDEAFLRRFSVIRRTPPTEAELKTLVGSFADRFELPSIPAEAAARAIGLSNQFNPVGSQPSKVTDLLAEVVAESRLRGLPSELSASTVDQVARELYQIPPLVFDAAERRRLLVGLPGLLEEQIVGQRALKATLVRLLERGLVQLTDRERPSVRLLVIGPRGVGKTQSAKVAAAALGLPCEEINMNDFVDPERDVAEFKRLLALAVKKNPFVVFILDELSLAHRAVQDVLRQIFLHGYLTVPESFGPIRARNYVKVDFRNASFVATANCGDAQILERFRTALEAAQTPRFSEEELRDWAVLGGIPAPLEDRFAAVVEALPATPEEFSQILRLHVLARAKALSGGGQPLSVENLEAFVAENRQRYYHVGMSNRIAQLIASSVDAAVAENVAQGRDGSAPLQLSLAPYDSGKYETSCPQRLITLAPTTDTAQPQ